MDTRDPAEFARAVARELLRASGELAERAPAALPAQETLERYLTWQRTRKTAQSARTDECYLRALFRGLEVEDLRELRAAHVVDYLTRRALEDELSPKTLNRIRECLHTLCEWLVEQDLLERNPVKKVRRAAEPASAITYLTLPQIDELLELLRAAPPPLEAFAAVCVFAGLRRGEAQWLRLDDVDLEHRVLRIRTKPGAWTPKTKRNRLVPISSRLFPYLEALPRADGQEWAFLSPMGHQVDGRNMLRAFRQAVAPRPWTILDLRHTFGTQLVMRGVSLVKVSALMGNSPEVCRRHYAHVATEELHQDVEF